MGGKNIRYTKHAIMRKAERGITDGEIEILLGKPDYTISSFEGRKIAVKRIDGKQVHVVYKEKISHIIVITVY